MVDVKTSELSKGKNLSYPMFNILKDKRPVHSFSGIHSLGRLRKCVEKLTSDISSIHSYLIPNDEVTPPQSLFTFTPGAVSEETNEFNRLKTTPPAGKITHQEETLEQTFMPHGEPITKESDFLNNMPTQEEDLSSEQ